MKTQKYGDRSILIMDDAMNIMDTMSEKGIKVDCIITDPPYKVTARGRGKNTSTGGMLTKDIVNKGKIFKHNDLEIEDWLPKLWDILVDKGHCYIMTNQKNITHYLKVIDTLYFNDDKKQKFHFIKNLIWLKDNKIMGQTYMSQFEYVIMLRKGCHKRINDCGTSDVLQYKNKKLKGEDNKSLHDTEKPVGLLKCLIENSTNEKDRIFDPFIGIGGLGVACVETNREFIGVEIDEDYFKIAVNRVNEVSN